MPRYVATTNAGLEPALKAELEALGADNIQGKRRAVVFEGDQRLLYRANLELRCALRVLMPLRSFKLYYPDDLYDAAYSLPWEELIPPRRTFSVDGILSSDLFNNSQYAMLRVKDAIVDRCRDKTGTRPNVNRTQAHIRVHLRLFKDRATISMDSSGEPLFKRGYRVSTVPAPLNEVLAAGIIGLSGWRGDRAFVDPMCGSGTLPIEAVRMARRIPSQMQRKSYAFQYWHDYDEPTWKDVHATAVAAIVPLAVPVLASDKNLRAYKVTQMNAENSGIDGMDIQMMLFDKLEKPAETGTLIMNPPYDERLKVSDVGEFYNMIGRTLKLNWTGYEAFILSTNKEALGRIGMTVAQRHNLYNGPTEARLNKYEVY